MSTARYAVYWAPQADHPLWHAGCEWLGRDPVRHGRTLSPQGRPVQAPARYGFHATLKAPLSLREGLQEAEFLRAVQDAAGRVQRFTMPALQVQWLGDFLALRPVEPIGVQHPLRQMADHAVQALDEWRARPSEAELKRREEAQVLSPTQAAALRRWGYPHVFEHWRFHMTLSDTLHPDRTHPDERGDLKAAAEAHFEPALREAVPCVSWAIFVEPAPDAPFVLAERFPLANDMPAHAPR